VTGPFLKKGAQPGEALHNKLGSALVHSRSLPRPQQGRPALIELRPESRDELRKRLRKMSDLELRRFGRRARKLSDPKMNSGATEPHVVELEEARAEWRRRHPVDPDRARRISGPGL
jgi:hypothetical protein